jgi:hypothetical protein
MFGEIHLKYFCPKDHIKSEKLIGTCRKKNCINLKSAKYIHHMKKMLRKQAERFQLNFGIKD